MSHALSRRTSRYVATYIAILVIVSAVYGESAAQTLPTGHATNHLNSIIRLQIDQVIASPADRARWILLAEVSAPYGLNVMQLRLTPRVHAAPTDDGKDAIILDASVMKGDNHREVASAWVAFGVAQIKVLRGMKYDTHSADCDARCPFRELLYEYNNAATFWQKAKDGKAISNEELDLMVKLQRQRLLAAWLYIDTFNAANPAYPAWAGAHHADLQRLFEDFLIQPTDPEAATP